MVKNKNHTVYWMTLGLAILCTLAFLASLGLGFAGFPSLEDETMRSIVVHLRLPRALGGFLAGGALSISGALVQRVLSNPLASTNILGINAGAGFFGLLASVWFPQSLWINEIGSFLGALLCAGFILALVRGHHASKLTILLAGLALSQLLSAGMDAITILYPDALSGYAAFKIGSLASLSLFKVGIGACVLIPTLCLVFALSKQLEFFSLGSFQATSLGFPLAKWSLVFLGLAAILASSVVSFCGMLGFIGLIVPAYLHRFRLSMPLYLIQCFLLGALLCEVADLLGRLLFLPWELPAGLLLSLIGGPYFLWMILERRHLDA